MQAASFPFPGPAQPTWMETRQPHAAIWFAAALAFGIVGHMHWDRDVDGLDGRKKERAIMRHNNKTITKMTIITIARRCPGQSDAIIIDSRMS